MYKLILVRRPATTDLSTLQLAPETQAAVEKARAAGFDVVPEYQWDDNIPLTSQVTQQ